MPTLRYRVHLPEDEIKFGEMVLRTLGATMIDLHCWDVDIVQWPSYIKTERTG